MKHELAATDAIQIEGLGKRYAVNGAQVTGQSFREMIMNGLRAPLRRYRSLAGVVSERNAFWALRSVSVEVARGEVVGVIGRNGAGKSTLLKVLTRITPPTEGRARIRGKVSSLLEVGTGFHPELTGRDNIFLNGAILGMSRPEIARKFNDIVEFAEVGRFIDTPVKRYSSGMHVRLAFSVAAHLDPDVLLVDEVLAVGDKQFQQRSIGKLQDVATSGRTVLYVSHNLGSVMDLCDRCLVLDGGKIVFDGPAEGAIRHYLELMSEPGRNMHTGLFKGPLAGQVCFAELTVNGDGAGRGAVVSPSERIRIECRGSSRVELSDFNIFVSIFKDGVRLTTMQDAPEGTRLRSGDFTSIVELPARFLRPGTYTIGIGGERRGQYQWVWGADVGQLTVLEQWDDGYEERNYGPINYAPLGERLQ